MRRGIEIWRQLDWLTIGLFALLALLGWLAVYAASYEPDFPSPFDPSKEYGRQFIWVMTGFVLAFLLVNVEGEFYNKFALPLYIVVCLLLLAVLLVGKEVNGAKAWFGVGNFGIQPSEFSKAAIALLLARYVNLQGDKTVTLRSAMVILGIIGLPALLILKQPDVGTILVFTGYILALYREGWSGNILIFGLGAVVLALISVYMSYTTFELPFAGETDGSRVLLGMLVLLTVAVLGLVKLLTLPRFRNRYYFRVILISIGALGLSASTDIAMDKVLQAHHKKRIEILLGLDDDPQGAGYNVKQSKTAIGSGGLMGKGFLQGPFSNYNFVPEQSTDFIFCTIGEEWGFIGSSLVLILYLTLMIRIVLLAERQRSRFSRVYGYAVASVLFMHMAVNIGMVIGLAPVIGIPLPFFSYGGSSLWGFTLLLFVFLRLDAERLTVFR
jgi:rod shape determining protein RodA